MECRCPNPDACSCFDDYSKCRNPSSPADPVKRLRDFDDARQKSNPKRARSVAERVALMNLQWTGCDGCVSHHETIDAKRAYLELQHAGNPASFNAKANKYMAMFVAQLGVLRTILTPEQQHKYDVLIRGISTHVSHARVLCRQLKIELEK